MPCPTNDVPRLEISFTRLRSTAYAIACRTARSCTPGLNFASGQFAFEQRLKASWVNEGEGARTGSMLSAFSSWLKLGRLDLHRSPSISPSFSALTTASVVPYLMNWISSYLGLSPRQFGFRSIFTMRPCVNSVTMYGPLPTSGSFGW